MEQAFASYGAASRALLARLHADCRVSWTVLHHRVHDCRDMTTWDEHPWASCTCMHLYDVLVMRALARGSAKTYPARSVRDVTSPR